ncbi:uncharacterized protein [Panulirus ornatus]|uniref:uncharacterized protein n=1 Tax=Panulirus ornatus TaxID=150431 RepID=UPI003A8AD29D
MLKVGSLFLLCLVAAVAGDENRQEEIQDINLGVEVDAGVNQKDQVRDTPRIRDSRGVHVQVSSGMNVQAGGNVNVEGVDVQDAYGENVRSRSEVSIRAGNVEVQVRDGVTPQDVADQDVQYGEDVNNSGGRVQDDGDGVYVQDTAAVKIWGKRNDENVRVSGIKGRYSLRKKREATEEETTDDESAAEGDEDVVEELPEPEGLAWINPMQLANQGVAMEKVPSLANLMGLQVVKYREPQPPFQMPKGHPRRSPNIHQQLPGAPIPKPFSRFDKGIHPFGNSFHDSFDRYYKSFNKKDLRNQPGGSSYNRPPLKTSGYNDPSSRSPPRHPAGTRFQSGGGYQHQPPANAFPRSPHPSLSDTAGSLLQLLDPFNLFGHNQFPQLPRYPLPPPNYYTPRNQPFQPSKQTESHQAEVKNIRDLDPKYEIIVDPNQEDHRGYQFKEDYPLRDDLYVGQDGNIYLKDDSVMSTSIPEQKEFGDDDRPSHNPTLQEPSTSRPQRPHLQHPTTLPKGRFEEEDIGSVDYDSGDDYEEDLNYVQLLKNHNMDEYYYDDFETPVQDTFPNSYRNSPQTPQRPPTHFDDHYQNGFAPSPPYNPNLVHNPTSPLLNYGFLKWLFPSYGRVTFPNYFYNPREVLLPRFQYPSGPWSNPGIPPRTGTRLHLSGTNYKQLPPRPSHPRAPVRNPPFLPPSVPGLSPSRPLPHNPSLRPSLRTPSPSPPSLHSPSLDHSSVRRLPGSRGNTRQHNNAKGTEGHTKTQFQGEAGRGDGFYPGNGFFDSDFPTLFHMSPSQQNRDMAQLPRPLAQNATAPADEQ